MAKKLRSWRSAPPRIYRACHSALFVQYLHVRKQRSCFRRKRKPSLNRTQTSSHPSYDAMRMLSRLPDGVAQQVFASLEEHYKNAQVVGVMSDGWV